MGLRTWVPGRVQQDIDTAKLLDRFADHPFGLSGLREIGLNDKSPGPGLLDRQGCLFQRGFRPGYQGDIGARFRQRKRHSLAQAPACPGNEGHVSLQIEFVENHRLCLHKLMTTPSHRARQASYCGWR